MPMNRGNALVCIQRFRRVTIRFSGADGDNRIILSSLPDQVPRCAWPNGLNRSRFEANQTAAAGCAHGGVDQASAPITPQPRGKLLPLQISQLRIGI